jgi:hypothetical protein
MAKQKTDKHEDVRLPELEYKVGDRALVKLSGGRIVEADLSRDLSGF